MDFKKARIITEETVKQAVKMCGQCDCDCDCACQDSDCACELYLDSLECNDC